MWRQQVRGGKAGYTATDDSNALWLNGAGIKQHFLFNRMVKVTTSPKQSWIKNDPGFPSARIVGMLTASLDIDPVDRPPSARLRKDNAQLTQPLPQISPQTVWMLAVRDTRDRAAFAALFDHFAPRLKGFVMRSGAGSAQAEEVVQEVMLTVWRKAGQFDPARAQVSAWIYQIARNRQIDVFRKERRPMPEELGEDHNPEPDANETWQSSRKPVS